jgi:DNA-binding transcriptional LysR family regulator
MSIDIINNSVLDFKLLLAFSTLFRERSVSVAAKKLGLGQPAMSHALNRLRKLFNDELFVRTSAGMEATVRARQLVQPIELILAQTQAVLLDTPNFAPAQSTRLFTVGMSDYTETILAPSLLARVREEAPGVQVIIRSIDRPRSLKMVNDEWVDLALGVFPEYHSFHCYQRLFQEEHVGVYNPKLLRLGRYFTLEEYLNLPHISVSLEENLYSPVDQVLHGMQLKRRIVFSTPRYLQAALMLEKMPMIATLPKRLATFCQGFLDLKVRKLPFESGGFEFGMLWHARNDQDPALAWLRRLIGECFYS